MAWKPDPGVMRIAGIGLEMAGIIALMLLAGYGFDAWRGTQPWGTIVGGMIGITLGMYQLIRRAWDALK